MAGRGTAPWWARPVLALALALGIALGLGLAAPPAARAEEAGLLADWLERQLSGAGRQVTIRGFQGALGAQARVEELAIADARGVWLRLGGVTLDWNRAALAGGTLDVTRLSARRVDWRRWPDAGPAPGLPGAAAAPDFRLPELPLAIRLGAVTAETVEIGAAVLGQAVRGRATADASLVAGQGHIRLALSRRDGVMGDLSIIAAYGRDAQVLTLAIRAAEAAGGLAVTALGVPGAPAAELTLGGQGRLDDFRAALRLDTAGATRLAGQVALGRAAGGGRRFEAALSGDMAPLFAPEFAPFLGARLALRAQGQTLPQGGFELTDLALTGGQIALEGRGRIGPRGLPERLALQGKIAPPPGQVTRLPWGGAALQTAGAELSLTYDRTRGPDWRLDLTGRALRRGGFAAETLRLTGQGRIVHGDETGAAMAALGAGIDGRLQARASGLAWTDPGLARALGGVLELSGDFAWRAGGATGLAFSRLGLVAGDLRLTGAGRVEGRGSGLTLRGQADLSAPDLARLAGLAGLPGLGGGGLARLTGWLRPLTGAFDGSLDLKGQDLALGLGAMPWLDGLLRGASDLRIEARRDETGTRLRRLALQAPGLRAQAWGRLTPQAADLAGDVHLPDLAALRPGWRGQLSGAVRLAGPLDDLAADVTANSVDLGLGLGAPDRLLAGPGRLNARLSRQAGRLEIAALHIETPALRLSASGPPQDLAIAARLADLGLIAPDFPGVLSAEGRLRQTATGQALDLAITGPGQIDARLQGQLAPGLTTLDLTARGTAQAGLANLLIAPRFLAGPARFDLALRGPLSWSSLSGQVTLDGGRLAAADWPFSLTGIEAEARIKDGQAQVTAQAKLAGGGNAALTGNLALAPPMAGRLRLDLARARISDAALFRTRVDGRLTLEGPVLGGATIRGELVLDETEFWLPTGSLAPLPVLAELRHRGDAPQVRATRARAGWAAGAGGTAARGAGGQGREGYGLDILVRAPARVFVRGRGLDAELAGQVRLTGTSQQVAPVGALSLLRGRLELLGKRLVLSEASLQLQGALVPYLRIMATTQTEGHEIALQIEGPASGPALRLTARPDLPQEEALALLIFGQNLQNLSPFQVARLAQAVAILAGQAGEGLVGRLRQGAGLDNLDIQAGVEGPAALTLGKYLTQNVYSELTLDEAGQSRIELNLDVNPNVTLKGVLEGDGQAGLGLYLQKDY